MWIKYLFFRKYPKVLTLKKLHSLMIQNPFNENDVKELFNRGYRPIYFNGKGCDGMSSTSMDRVYVKKCTSNEEMKIFLHELIHLVFPFPATKVYKPYLYYSWPGGDFPYSIKTNIKEKYERLIETEEDRIYKNKPEIICKIKKAFNFPGEEIYVNKSPLKPNQLELFKSSNIEKIIKQEPYL